MTEVLKIALNYYKKLTTKAVCVAAATSDAPYDMLLAECKLLGIVTKTGAKLRGASTYNVGATCKHGHTGPRFLSNDGCVICNRDRAATKRQQLKEHRAQFNATHTTIELVVPNDMHDTVISTLEMLLGDKLIIK